MIFKNTIPYSYWRPNPFVSRSWILSLDKSEVYNDTVHKSRSWSLVYCWSETIHNTYKSRDWTGIEMEQE